jgi:hypothetical protein
MKKIVAMIVLMTACGVTEPKVDSTAQAETCFPSCGGDGDPIAASSNASVADVRAEYHPDSVDRVACGDAAGGMLCEVSVSFGSHHATLYCHVRYHTADDGSVVVDEVHCGST